MNWQFSYIEVIFFLSFLVSGLLGFYCYKNGKYNKNISNLGFVFLATSLWSFSYIFELAAKNLELKIMWSKISYLPTLTAPVFYFIFCWCYTRNEINPRAIRNFFPLFIFPVLIIVMVWTNEWHHLIWNSFTIYNWNDLVVCSYGHQGWLFKLYVTYSYCMILIGSVKLLYDMYHYPAYYKNQIFYMLLFVLFPLIASALYLAQVSFFAVFDFTPVGMCIGSVWLSLGIYKYNFFAVAPVARDTVLDRISEGLLVVSLKGQVRDFNNSARNFFPESNLQIGCNISLLIKDENIERSILTAEVFTEIEFSISQKALLLSISPLHNKFKRLIGRVLLVHDISHIKEYENILEKQAVILEKSLKELQKTKEIEIELERKSTILAMIVTANHEINQPLCILRGYLDLLSNSSYVFSNEKKERYISDMKNAVNQISGILEKFKNSENVELSDYAQTNTKMFKFAEKNNLEPKKLDKT